MENPCYSIQMVWAVLTKFIHSVSLKHKTAQQDSATVHILFCVGDTMLWPRGKTKIQNRAKCLWRHNRSHSSITISTVMWMELNRQLCSFSETESISGVCIAKHETSICSPSTGAVKAPSWHCRLSVRDCAAREKHTSALPGCADWCYKGRIW